MSREELSKKCYERLETAGLANHYKQFVTKTAGRMQGVTLFGETKKGIPKKTYVKCYNHVDFNGDYLDKTAFNELFDYAAFQILNRCGVRAPKVKLKSAKLDKAEAPSTTTRPEIFLFSKDIAQSKSTESGEKKYWYRNKMDVVGKYACEISNGNLNFNEEISKESENQGFDIPKSVPIDKENIARTLLLIKILNLYDLHDENIGYVVSEINGKVKAKLAIIDFFFCFDSCPEFTGNSLSNCVASHFDCSLKSSLQESDFLKAYDTLEQRFLPACTLVKKEIEKMPFETQVNKDKVNAKIDNVISAFEKLKKFVHSLKPENEPMAPSFRPR